MSAENVLYLSAAIFGDELHGFLVVDDFFPFLAYILPKNLEFSQHLELGLSRNIASRNDNIHENITCLTYEKCLQKRRLKV